MDREGEGTEYDSFHISRETEEMWTEEYITCFLNSKLQGKEAYRSYSTMAELLKSDRQNKAWDICLYYPLRAECLDDVTILYMLPVSFRMAEKAVKKNRFSREDADAYLQELNRYVQLVQFRAEKGVLTRSPDYTMLEFSDPVYITEYLDSLEKKWKGLFH